MSGSVTAKVPLSKIPHASTILILSLMFGLFFSINYLSSIVSILYSKYFWLGIYQLVAYGIGVFLIYLLTREGSSILADRMSPASDTAGLIEYLIGVIILILIESAYPSYFFNIWSVGANLWLASLCFAAGYFGTAVSHYLNNVLPKLQNVAQYLQDTAQTSAV